MIGDVRGTFCYCKSPTYLLRAQVHSSKNYVHNVELWVLMRVFGLLESVARCNGIYIILIIQMHFLKRLNYLCSTRHFNRRLILSTLPFHIVSFFLAAVYCNCCYSSNDRCFHVFIYIGFVIIITTVTDKCINTK